MKTRSKLASLLTIAGLMTTSGLAGAQTAVDVIATGDGGSRTLFVEDVLGQDLTQFNFGDGGALPFRVRVVDANMTREAFTVNASMTNLYKGGVASADEDDFIKSENISVSSLTDPIGVSGVAAKVQPLFDVASVTITDGVTGTCAALGLPVAATCELTNVGAVQGKVQEVALSAADRTKVPLLPQQHATGAFTLADYVGDFVALDPGGAYEATSKLMLGGTVVSTADALALVDGALATVVGAAARTDLVDDAVLLGAIRNNVGAAVFDLLSLVQKNALVGAAVDLDVQGVSAGQLLAQTGTYLSYPVLNLTVPAATAIGTYEGVLSVTAIQP